MAVMTFTACSAGTPSRSSPPSILITAKIFRPGPTSWRTARTFAAAASRSISRVVGLGGRDVSVIDGSSGEGYPDGPARHSGGDRFVLTSGAMATEITPAV